MRATSQFLQLGLMVIAALALAAFIWFVGPVIAPPLTSASTRFVVGAVLLVLPFLILGVRVIAAKARERRMIAAIAQPPSAELGTLAGRLGEALAQLGRVGAGRRQLDQVPWYLVIGPPGAGKTTALVNSGLRFPLAEGATPVAGIGGTRNCDWWFADDAVLIDTAGRYTTQDSDPEADRAAWLGFLGLLRRHRGPRAVNGVIIAVGVDELLTAASAQGRAIADRLDELHAAFGWAVPAYLVLTKLDRIAGFVEFFGDLDAEGRRQAWGAALTSPDPATVGAAFDRLLRRLNDRLIDRLQAESDAGARALIFEFPAQVATLRQPLLTLLDEVFGERPAERRLRGLYLTSATQHGQPIDRLRKAMAGAFGVAAAATVRPGQQGRSYFLYDPLRKAVFAESWLVEAGELFRRRFLVRATAAALAVLALGVAGLWTASYVANRALVDRATAVIDVYDRDAAAANPADAAAIAAVLDPVRAAAADFGVSGPLVELGFGQAERLQAAMDRAYGRGLHQLLLPQLLGRLEQVMAASLASPVPLYEALKVYLMLGGRGPLDPGQVAGWAALDWRGTYAQAAQAPVRDRLAVHLAALLEQVPEASAIDAALVEQARAALREQPAAIRAYALIRQLDAARSVPEWRVDQLVGADGATLLTRRSGLPLDYGIPGLFTHDGFYTAFLPIAADASRLVAGDAWVLDEAAPVGIGGSQRAALLRDVLGLYLEEYALAWDSLLVDLVLAPVETADEAARLVALTSRPDSPLLVLLVAVVLETTLTRPHQDPTFNAAAAEIAALLPGEAPPWKYIDDRYAGMRDLLENPSLQPDEAAAALLELTGDLAAMGDFVRFYPAGTEVVDETATDATDPP